MSRLFKLRNFNFIWASILFLPVILVALFLFRFSPDMQSQVLILFILIYLLFAILHHFRDKTLTLEIFLEYILIAALAAVVLQGVVF